LTRGLLNRGISVCPRPSARVRWAGAGEAIEAWWLNATFTPFQTEYESLGIKDIDPKWVKLTVLTYYMLPSDAKPDLALMCRDGVAFQVDNTTSNGRGLSTGSYAESFQDDEGRKGRFLLVLERADGQHWKVAFLHEEAGEAGFSMFVRRPIGLYWGTCMQCDEFSRLRLTKGAFRLETEP
jgi:hypothetical protein